MLLELARETIARAEKDSNEPIPVVFNLASWVKHPISAWLINDLITMYSVPDDIARFWIENDKLLLLLDGLDEVPSDYREDCIKEINKFRKKHLVSIVICSHLADYEVLNNSLNVQSAVLLQPLTEEQVSNYLSLFGQKVDSLLKVIRSDIIFRELSQTPLMLNIMILAYGGKSTKEIRSSGDIKEQRKHLFECYVEQMFKRRSPKQPYSPKKTKHWLSWIARNMSSFSRSIFLIEEIENNWLADEHVFYSGDWEKRSKLTRLAEKMPLNVAISIGIVSGLIGLLIGGLNVCVSFGLIGMFVGYNREIKIIEKPAFSLFPLSFSIRKEDIGKIVSYMLMGVLLGLIFGAIFWLFSLKDDKLVRSLVGGILFFVLIIFYYNYKKLLSELDQKLPFIQFLYFALIYALFSAAIIWFLSFIDKPLVSSLIAGILFYVLIVSLDPYHLLRDFPNSFYGLLKTSLSHAFFGGLFSVFVLKWVSFLDFLLLYGLFESLVFSYKRTVDKKTLPEIPNQGIKNSLKFALSSLIVYGFICGLISGLFGWQIGGYNGAFYYSLVGFSFFGLMCGLAHGGRSYIQHIELRIVLWYKGFLPLNCSRFLNYAVERVFLRKIGGGYIFIHRELMDYFASLEENRTYALDIQNPE